MCNYGDCDHWDFPREESRAERPLVLEGALPAEAATQTFGEPHYTEVASNVEAFHDRLLEPSWPEEVRYNSPPVC